MFNPQMDGKELIEQFYYDEKQKALEDESLIVNQAVTVRFNVAHACMLSALSRRFGETRASIMKRLIEAETVKMFDALSDKDKQVLALEADKEMTSFMLDAGHTISSAGIEGSFENEWSEWRGHLKMHEFFEDRIKEQEKEEK